MIFTKLNLRNFKSHKNTTIDFEPGISIIVGENGAGKSTILEAISFSLFKQHSGKKIDDLVRITKNKNSYESMSVTLEFNSNGKDYKITRNRGNSSKAELLVKDSDGGTSRIASGDKSVNNEIHSIIEMDADLFLNAIYIQQGQIANLIGKTPSEKKQLIGKLLGVEGLEKAWKNSLVLINDYEKQKSNLEGQTASNLELTEDLKTKKIILDNIKVKGSEFEKEVNELEELKKAKLAEKLEMEEAKITFEKLNSQLINENENTKKVIEDKKRFQDQLDEIVESEKEMIQLERFSLKLPIYLDFLDSVKKLEQLTKEKDEHQEKVDSISKQKEILKNEENSYNEYLEIEKTLNIYNERKSKLESKLEIAKSIEKEKKITESEIANNESKIKEFFDKTNKSLNINVEDFKELKRTVSDFKVEAIKKLEDIDKKTLDKSQEISRLKEGINSTKKPLDEIKEVYSKCPLCKSDITEEKKNDLIESYNETINSNKKSIKEIEKEINKFNSEKSIFKSKLEDINSAETDISDNMYMYEMIKKDLGILQDQNTKLKYYEDVGSKLNDLLLLIKEEKKQQEITKENYKNYMKAKGSLDTLGKEHDAKDNLREVTRSFDNEVEKIKVAMSKDSYLSPDISEENLKNRIEDLREKDKKYNQLSGVIKQKPILQSQIKTKRDYIDSIRSKIDNIENNIKACKYNQDKFKNIVFTYERSEEKLAELNKKLNELKGKATEIIANIEELDIKLSQNSILKEKLENVEEYLGLLKEIRGLYSKDGIQKELRNRSKPLIQKYTKVFFEQFNFNYSDLKIDEEYNISVFGPEGESKLEMVSGGEKIAIALALRLGITQAMSKGNIETILLDEPTIHLDSYRRHELIDLLRQMSSLPQMIIVTHDSELENAADNIIKVQKEDGASKVVVGE